MSMLILAETPAGYALFKAKDKKLLKKDDLGTQLATADGAASLLKLKSFVKFESAASALEEVTNIVESKVSPMLASLLDSIKDEKKATLVVSEPKLGNAINKLPGLSFTIVADSTTQDIYRSIREHLTALIPGLTPTDVSTMSLGLSHSLSRHKLKFSADKVDTMIVQAIALLDDLDKELNVYAMRVKEWYGWHFPEMARIINDNMAYAKVIKTMGMRSNAHAADLSEILPEEIETALKAAAEVSMGTEITTEDLENINALAEQVIALAEYRQQLSSYLTARMNAIAPNLTVLVGELVGARLIAHAGSLMNLAKSPASTVQILGAEKALFRALKTKHDTPKYGLIYHASLIGQATGKNKGKVARMLSTKTALGLRVDALGDDKDESGQLGLDLRNKVEARVRALEGKSALPKANIPRQPGKWELSEAKKYNPDVDTAMADADAPPARAAARGDAMDVDGDSESEKKGSKKEKKDKSSKKRKSDLELRPKTPVEEAEESEEEETKEEPKEKKSKKDKKDKKDKKEKKDKDGESRKKRRSESPAGGPSSKKVKKEKSDKKKRSSD